MLKKRWRLWLSAFCTLLMLALTACEALQGYEINQALQKTVTMTSLQSKGSLAIELIPGNLSSLSERDKQILNVFKDLKVNVKESKMQDWNHSSIDAELVYSKGTIPFRMVYNGGELVVTLEGGKKPIVFHTTETSIASALADQGFQKDLEKKVAQLTPVLMKFVINNAPNPRNINVSSTTEQIHNESLSVQKVHAELYGDELEGLLKKFLTNVLKDDKGLKELLSQLYDILMPTIKEALSSVKDQLKESSLSKNTSFDVQELLFAYLDNKTLVVEFSFTTIQQMIKMILKQWEDESIADSSGLIGQAQRVLSDQTFMKTDLYIDSQAYIRKANSEIKISLGEENSVSAVKITSSFENWNNNKPVTADTIDLSAGSVDIGPLQSMKPYKLLNNLDTNSTVYRMLKNDLQLTKKQFTLLIPDHIEDNPYNTYPFINRQGVTMVPARIVSEKLGAELQWDIVQKKITIIDGVTGTPVVLKIGSSQATVNGNAVDLDSPPIIKNGSAYVPLRFIIEALGCKLQWNDSEHSITITRD